MICTACGFANPDGMKFCGQCGGGLQARTACSPRWVRQVTQSALPHCSRSPRNEPSRAIHRRPVLEALRD
jgi:hypothetical protein